MRFWLACGFLLLAISPCISQNSLVTVEHKNSAIDMLGRIKSAVALRHKGNEAPIYKAISMRLFQCSTAFSKFAKVDSDPYFPNATRIDALVSSFIYPYEPQYFNVDMGLTLNELTKILRDEKKTFNFMRNCHDFDAIQIDRLAVAIDELPTN